MDTTGIVAALEALPKIPPGRVRGADGRPDFAFIRAVYEKMLPEIMQAERWTDPYFIDWMPIFTPIESQMWSLIRLQGAPFYPQFPVGRFFVDFGNPHRRIAIECDGAKWHNHARDRERDRQLFDLGWSVVRFSGNACFRMVSLSPDIFNAPPFTPTDMYWRFDEPEESGE